MNRRTWRRRWLRAKASQNPLRDAMIFRGERVILLRQLSGGLLILREPELRAPCGVCGTRHRTVRFGQPLLLPAHPDEQARVMRAHFMDLVRKHPNGIRVGDVRAILEGRA